MAAVRVAPVRPGRRRQRLPWGILLPWVLTATILAATAAFAVWPREAELRSPTTPGHDGALIWGDGVFANSLELEAWLRARGVSYRDWARKHPAAVRLLAPGPNEAPVPAAPPAERGGVLGMFGFVSGEVFRGLLLGLVLLVVVVGSALWSRRLRVGRAAVGLRLGLGLSAVGVGIGVAAASLFL